MKIYEGLDDDFRIPGAVVTAGTFDGVHVGHRKIINRVKDLAGSVGGESVVVTFEPHPRLVLFPDDNQLRLLSTLDEKKKLLREAGVQHLVVVRFTKEFSRLTARQYIQDILVDKLNMQRLVVGYDHQFGRNREGSIDELRELAPDMGFEVEEIPAQDIDDVRVSSTKIRAALQEGDILTANTYLTYKYGMQGTVVHGDKRGRTIGFPTANIFVDEPLKLVPGDGVYAVLVTVGNKTAEGMLNIGVRPTVDGVKHSVEVHIFGWNEEIYGQQVYIQFADRIRDEMKFAGLEELKNQLKNDAAMAKQLLGNLV